MVCDPSEIDWSKFTEAPQLTCRCGESFRSKIYIDYNTGKRWSEWPCPNCKRNDNIYSISYDREVFGT